MCLVIVVVRHGKQLIEYFFPLFFSTWGKVTVA